jgi:hypothetical protein
MAKKQIPLKTEGFRIEACIVAWRWLLLHSLAVV